MTKTEIPTPDSIYFDDLRRPLSSMEKQAKINSKIHNKRIKNVQKPKLCKFKAGKVK